MKTTNTAPRVVYTGDSSWWEIVSRGEIEADTDGWHDRWQEATEAAGVDTDDEESWVAVVTYVDPRHSAIRVGDYACSQGIGSEVVFVRLLESAT